MKLTKKENMHVVVEPDLRYLRNPKEDYVKNICETIKQQVKRHVDEAGDVYIQWDTVEYCEFCGYSWEEDQDGPVCCGQAQKEWDNHKEDK